LADAGERERNPTSSGPGNNKNLHTGKKVFVNRKKVSSATSSSGKGD